MEEAWASGFLKSLPQVPVTDTEVSVAMAKSDLLV